MFRMTAILNSQLKYLITAFFVLGLTALFIRRVSEAPKITETKLLGTIAVQDIDSFQVNNFTLGLLLKRDGDSHKVAGWQVKKFANAFAEELSKKAGAPLEDTESEFYPANPLLVSKVLAYLVEQTIGEPVATLSGEANSFEINDYSLHVILFGKDGKELDGVWIGKAGPDLMTSFVKKRDANSVYVVRQNLHDLFLRPLEYWRTQMEEKVMQK